MAIPTSLIPCAYIKRSKTIIFEFSIDSTTNSSNNSMANGGVYMIEGSLFSNYQKNDPNFFSLEKEILPQLLIQKKRIAGFFSQNSFVDIGVPEDYNLATEILSQHI